MSKDIELIYVLVYRNYVLISSNMDKEDFKKTFLVMDKNTGQIYITMYDEFGERSGRMLEPKEGLIFFQKSPILRKMLDFYNLEVVLKKE